MNLHVLTLSWNGLDKLEKLKPGLENNFNQLKDIDNSRWYIRDNGSKDETVKTTAKWHNTVVFDVGHNRGSFSEGVNFLFEQANPSDDDLVMLLNNDIIMPNKNAIQNMIDANSKYGAELIGCLLVYPKSKKISHAGVIFSNRYGKMPWHYRAGEAVDENAKKLRYFQAVTAACCLFPARVFRAAGGLDPKFKWAFEDVSFGLYVNSRKPNNVIMCGAAIVEHEESASLNKNPVNKMFMNSNVRYFKHKWFGKYEIDHDKYLKNPNYNEV